jgi:hypothetical protein
VVVCVGCCQFYLVSLPVVVYGGGFSYYLPGYLLLIDASEGDNANLKRLKEMEKLDPSTKTKVFFDIIDTYLRDFKTRRAYMA